ncbi:MAG: DNA-directed RNA polymerase subunit K [Methanobacteriaceae archaeon]|jgi:DNA-directed RNA polymerase subunit K|uniref:DNA-directed RNA polymerase subunit K n=1 Tax=Methanobrevibacter TaxID=2172 RepID=UPI002A0D7528|nr:DNA-directed RNA polymerase subunit K [Methanobacteriaceae archaeon]MDD3408209.1 DNA-directed RNA polymerase subunit K [Methanobacteriaceae archaeon]MDD4594084.1 DNA-directed RNA polymerase subunit K [Methanobacteriaceae archaeon]
MPAKKTSTKKSTAKKYTRFEKARLLGSRAIQLSMGAKPLVKVTEDDDPIDIALAELKENVLPLDVKPRE